MIFSGKKILLGITGSIAAYKAAEVVREFVKTGAEVQVMMTDAGQEFITPLTLETLSGKPVMTRLFPQGEMVGTRHISITRWADLVVICPATANIVGKVAHGIADDLVSTILLATEPGKILFALAMNSAMYLNPIVQENKKHLESLGYQFVEPETGDLADADSYGIGRLAELSKILFEVKKKLFGSEKLRGKKVLVTAGRTEESIDPVRFLSNRSTGKMGYAIAEWALLHGAQVTLVTGPAEITPPPGCEVHPVTTAEEMYLEVIKYRSNTDVIVMAAAVADYTLEQPSDRKIKKTGSGLEISLKNTRDILKELGENKNGHLVVGFALETDRGLENAKKKLNEKNADLIVLNDATVEGAGFGTDTNVVTILRRDGKTESLPKMSKWEVSREIWDRIISMIH